VVSAAASPSLLPPSLSGSPLPKRRVSLFSTCLLIVAFLIVWAARSFAPEAVGVWFYPLPVQSPGDLVLMLAALAAAMVVHEAGHLFAALFLGFRVLGCSLGPVHFQFLHGQSKLSWSAKTFFSASVSAVPSSADGWRTSMLSVVAAGPLFTLAGAVCAAGFHAATHTEALLQLAFVQISLLLFALGLIPNSRKAALSNDARLFFDLAVNNGGGEEMELKVLLKQHVLAGTRPQDYPHELLLRLARWQGRPETQLAFAQAVTQWALDCENSELADLWDSHTLALAQQCSPRVRNTALAWSACVDILIREDLEASREKFAQVNFSALFPPCLEHRSRGAQQIALGHAHRAPTFIIRAQYSLPRGIRSYDLERMLLEKLHMRVLRQRPASPKANYATV
jgi:hypothetical protein